MMNYKLSVIIPCFNCSSTLVEAVESCFDQGFGVTEFEIVLVDDCSTDTTRRVMQELAHKYGNIRLLFNEKNLGGGGSRNTASHAAAADTIFCLDSDDILPTNTLKTLYEFKVEKNADGVGVATSTKFKGTDPDEVVYVNEFSNVGERITLENLLQRDGRMCSLYSVFMFSKEAFIKTGGYPTTHGFDTQGFAWRFLAAGLQAYTCPQTNYLHRIQHSQSYYLREYATGRTNINWQHIFLEHSHLFLPEIIEFIRSYDVTDFTRNLFDEVVTRNGVFLPEAKRQYGRSTLTPNLPNYTVIAPSSFRGIRLRIKHRLRILLTDHLKLKPLVLWFITFRTDVMARFTAPKTTHLLIAYLGLRLRKLIHRDFKTDESGSRGPVDIVIPTIGKEFRLLETYLTHLRSFLREKIGNIYIVAPDTDEAIKDFCLKHGLTFINERAVLGYGKEKITYHVGGVDRRGWLFQQLLKLSGDAFVANNHYIIIDSDTLIIRPLQFTQKNKYILYESTEWHQPYFESFKKLFNYSAPHPLSFTSHMMIFSVEKLTLMKKEIAARHGKPWDEAYLDCCNTGNNSGISDYETYGQWLLRNFPNEVTTRPLYNKALSRRDFSSLPDLEKKYYPVVASLSFHSYK